MAIDLSGVYFELVLGWIPQDLSDKTSKSVQLLPSGNKPLSDRMLKQLYDATWHHQWCIYDKSVLTQAVIGAISQQATARPGHEEFNDVI